MREWIVSRSIRDVFGPKQFDICVISARNEQTRRVLLEQKYSFSSLTNVARKSAWGQVIPSRRKMARDWSRLSRKKVNDGCSEFENEWVHLDEIVTGSGFLTSAICGERNEKLWQIDECEIEEEWDILSDLNDEEDNRTLNF